MKTTAPTAAHTQTETAKYVVYYPDHTPRESDAHYPLFEATRKRVIAAGVGCWICGSLENRELHHSEVEFAVANGIDYERLAADHPEYAITDEESFLNWVESEGNLLVLCKDHHRSPFLGIHHVDGPSWKAQKYWRHDLPPILQSAHATPVVAVSVPEGSTVTITTETTQPAQ